MSFQIESFINEVGLFTELEWTYLNKNKSYVKSESSDKKQSGIRSELSFPIKSQTVNET